MHSATDRETPPLSPVLLAGLALRPLPVAPLGPLLSLAMSALGRRHPAVFDRLANLGDACFVIDPVDLPFCFLLRPGSGAPRLDAIKDGAIKDGAIKDGAIKDGAHAAGATAVIRGPLLALIDLLEGRVDGDALFFSRNLTIEGDTGAVLTLRNAVDSGEIKVVDASADAVYLGFRDETNARIAVETEVFAFGGLCVMAEGRCALSSYATGQSPNMNGVCSPASHVRYERRADKLVSRLGRFTINALPDGEPAGYPTLCKGRFVAGGRPFYLFEEPTSLDVSGILPEFAAPACTR